MIRVIFLALLAFAAVSAQSIVVAPDGSDETGDGSLGAPYATLSKASREASPGDTIHMRGGVYNRVQQINGANGTAEAPIVVRPYGEELPIVDGAGLALASNEKLLDISNWGDTIRHYSIEGIEVRNSSGRGVGFRDVDGLTIRDCVVHDIDFYAIGGSGKNVEIRGNEVYRAAMTNENGSYQGGGWPGVIQCYNRWAEEGAPGRNDPSEDILIAENHVHDCWGEGILVTGTVGVTIEGNVLHDIWSVYIYLGKARAAVVRNNYIYVADSTYDRPDTELPGAGLWFGNEMGFDEKEFPVSDVLAYNNVMVGVGAGIRFWLATDNLVAENTYSDMRFYHNVVVDPVWGAVRFDDIPDGYDQPTGCELRNNIFGAGGFSSSLPDASGWTSSNNLWEEAAPSWASDPSESVGDPAFVNHVLGGAPEGYALASGSPAIDAGVATSVTTDFLGAARDASPDVGAFEYGATSVDRSERPERFSLKPAYPNPFNPTTTVAFSLPRAGEIELAAFNALGEPVATLYAGYKTAGDHETAFDASDLPSGVYFIRLRAEGSAATTKAILLK
ncbi:MAG: T9SS type A sorting domain-containing protein [Ignavibacteriales bacterium]|nr:T9SS type A sorting domain-containing protein [Ignavibacteriales bacterium]